MTTRYSHYQLCLYFGWTQSYNKKRKKNTLQTYGNANLRLHSAAVKRLLLLGSIKSYQPSITT